MSQTQAPVEMPSVAITLGAIEIGVMVSSLLYGVTCVQVYLFGSNTSRRPPIFKSIVAFIFVLESVHLIFMWIYFFDMTVTHFGQEKAIERVTWRFGVAFCAHAILSSAIQGFFCYRIWVLSRNKLLAVPPALGSVARGFMTFATSVLFVIEGVEGFHEKHHDPLVYTVLILSAVVDLWITTSLVALLWRRKTGYRSTIEVINGIMYWTVETGLLTTISAVLILIFFMALGKTGLWNMLLLIYPRLYANSLLVSLNSTGGKGNGKNSGVAAYSGTGSSGHQTDGIVITRSFNVEMPEYPRAVTEDQTSEGEVFKGLGPFDAVSPTHYAQHAV